MTTVSFLIPIFLTAYLGCTLSFLLFILRFFLSPRHVFSRLVGLCAWFPLVHVSLIGLVSMYHHTHRTRLVLIVALHVLTLAFTRA